MTNPKVGDRLHVIMLDKPGVKRTGETRPVRVLALTYLWGCKDAVRHAEVETTDVEMRDPRYRRQWVEPKYLLEREAQGVPDHRNAVLTEKEPGQ